MQASILFEPLLNWRNRHTKSSILQGDCHETRAL